MLEGAVVMLIRMKCMCFVPQGCRLLPYSDHKKNAKTIVFYFSYLPLLHFFFLSQQAAEVFSKCKALILLHVSGLYAANPLCI